MPPPQAPPPPPPHPPPLPCQRCEGGMPRATAFHQSINHSLTLIHGLALSPALSAPRRIIADDALTKWRLNDSPACILFVQSARVALLFGSLYLRKSGVFLRQSLESAFSVFLVLYVLYSTITHLAGPGVLQNHLQKYPSSYCTCKGVCASGTTGTCDLSTPSHAVRRRN